MSLQEIATTEHARAPAKPERATKERISPKVREALNLLATGECTTQRAACARVGLHEVTLSRALSKPAARAFIARESARNIEHAQLRASRRFVDLIDADSEHVAAKVSDRILTSAGILKAEAGSQVAVNVGVSVGYVIDTSRRRSDHASDAHLGQMPTIEAKPLTDKGTGQS